MNEQTHKQDLDAVARAIYPHKQDRFTYSTPFLIEEIQKLQAQRDELKASVAQLQGYLERYHGGFHGLKLHIAIEKLHAHAEAMASHVENERFALLREVAIPAYRRDFPPADSQPHDQPEDEATA